MKLIIEVSGWERAAIRRGVIAALHEFDAGHDTSAGGGGSTGASWGYKVEHPDTREGIINRLKSTMERANALLADYDRAQES
jgi:hypothetical protein